MKKVRFLLLISMMMVLFSVCGCKKNCSYVRENAKTVISIVDDFLNSNISYTTCRTKLEQIYNDVRLTADNTNTRDKYDMNLLSISIETVIVKVYLYATGSESHSELKSYMKDFKKFTK